MRIRDLTDKSLDWAVAKAKGDAGATERDDVYTFLEYRARYGLLYYSTLWSCGGPIIDSLIKNRCRIYLNNNDWFSCYDPGTDKTYIGPTVLVAAMRCYAASRLGEEIEVPKELL